MIVDGHAHGLSEDFIIALEVTFGFYSPDITFCYPGGEGPLNTPPHGI
jgi:hypothetical protein